MKMWLCYYDLAHINIVSDKMHEELIVDMVNEGIDCLLRSNKKYAGSVTRVNKDGGNVAWLLKVKQSFVSYKDIPHNYIVATMMDMEKIRQMAREQGVDLAVQGLVLLPRSLGKYTGHIQRHEKRGGGFSYVAIIIHKDFYCLKSFKTEAEADKYVRNVSVREGLPIRNKFTVFADRVKVELTKGKILICDYADLHIVEMHTWHYSYGYAITRFSGDTTLKCFHNAVMKHSPTDITVDHISRNSLDKHQANLRLVDKTTQSINQGMKSNNKSSVTGVLYDKRGDNWVATWKDADGYRCCKSYNSKKYGNDVARTRAIEHWAWMIWSLPHYVEAL